MSIAQFCIEKKILTYVLSAALLLGLAIERFKTILCLKYGKIL